jgi:hypothetical protein
MKTIFSNLNEQVRAINQVCNDSPFHIKTSYLLLLVTLLSTFSACQNKEGASASEENSIPTQVIKWKSGKDFQIKDIVRGIQYIPLEDNENSLFSTIDKLIIKGDRIYLLDITGLKSLLVFDITGKFLHRVGRQGNGPGEYSHFINFDILDNGIVSLYDHAKRHMMIYDADGNYIQSIKSSYSFNDFCMLSNSCYLLALDIYEKNNNKRKVSLAKNLKHIEKSWFYFSDDYKNDRLNIRVFQPYKDNIAYMLPIASDTLFIFDRQGTIQQAYFFDFGNQKLPEKLKNSYEETINKRKQGIYYTYFFNTPILVRNYIFAIIFMENQKYITVFDRVNNTSTYEALTPENFSIEHVNFPLCAINDSIIVSYIDSNLYDAIKDRISVNPEIDNHLMNGGAIICLNTIR